MNSTRFTFIEKLGEGGMGVVHKSWDERHRRTVAIKYLRREIARASLADEAHTLAQFEHPGIARFHDWFEDDDGTITLVMEYVDGQRLDHWVHSQPFPLLAAVGALRRLCEALGAIHTASYLHLDLKLSNVKVTPQGRLKLLDFGAAVRMRPAADGRRRARPRAGTPAYQAPEHTRALIDPDVTLDETADLYSLGVLAYELVTGRKPFRGSPAAMPQLHARSLPRPPHQIDRSIPAALDALILRLLEKEPRHRYTRAQEVDEALRAVEETLSAVGPGQRRPRSTHTTDASIDLTVDDVLSSLKEKHGITPLDRIGNGAMGEVWRASNGAGQTVALKAVNPCGPLEERCEVLARVRREFAIQIKLRHRNIVRLHKMYADSPSALVLEMEHVDGPSLDAAVAAHATPARAAVAWMAEVCAALEYAHDRRVIHRDLKPSNILVGRDEVVRVCDFGLAHEDGDFTRMTQTGTLLGTVEYLSPEQLQGLPSAPSMDIYAIGVILYRLLAGTVPFPLDVGGDAVASMFTVMQHHLETRAPRLDVPDLPAALVDLVARLLDKNPARRPLNAAAIRAVLLDVAEKWHGADELPSLDAVERSVDVPLVGRLKERALLLAALERAVEAHDVTCVTVEGGWGSGRTRMLDELERGAEVKGTRCVRWDALRCVAGAADSSCDSAGGRFDRLLRDAMGDAPCALVISLDGASRDDAASWFARASSAFAGRSALVVATDFPCDGGRASADRISLGALDLDDTRMLARNVLRRQLIADDVQRVHAHCEGMPGHVVVLLQHLVQRGLMDEWGESATLGRGWDAEVPQAVGATTLRALDGVPEFAMAVLGCAAALRVPFDVALLAAAADGAGLARVERDASRDAFELALDAALDCGMKRGLLTSDGDGRWRMISPLVGEAVARLHPPPVPSVFHRRVARLLQDRVDGSPRRQRREIARHHERAGDLRAALEAWQTAGIDAEASALEQIEAWTAALDLLQRDDASDAEELVYVLRERSRRLRTAVADTRAQDEARRGFLQAVALCRKCVPLTQAAALSECAQVLQYDAPDRANEMLTEALDLLGDVRTDAEVKEKAYAHVRLGVLAVRRKDGDVALEEFARAEPLLRKVEDWSALIDVQYFKSQVYADRRMVLAQRKALREQQRIARREGLGEKLILACINVGQLYMDVSRPRQAGRYYSNASDLIKARQIPPKRSLAYLHTNRGVHHFTCGDWSAAYEDYEQAGRIYEELSEWAFASRAHVNRSELLCLQGNLVGARRAIGCARKALRRLSSVSSGLWAFVLHRRGLLCYQRARRCEVSTSRWLRAGALLLKSAIQHADRAWNGAELPSMLVSAAETLIAHAGEQSHQEIRTLLQRALNEARGSGDVRSEAQALRALGYSIAESGSIPNDAEFAEAERLYRDALSKLVALENPYFEARARAALGLLLARDPDRRMTALAMLQEACSVFQRLGAKVDVFEVTRKMDGIV